MHRILVLMMCFAIAVAKQKPRKLYIEDDFEDDYEDDDRNNLYFADTAEKCDIGKPVIYKSISVNSIAFNFFDTKLNWHNAYLYCASLCMHLANIESICEDTAIASFLGNSQSPTEKYWVGGTSLGQVNTTDFRWAFNGKPFKDGHENWSQGQPDGSGRCVQTNYNGKWDDDKCEEEKYFICVSDRVCTL